MKALDLSSSQASYVLYGGVPNTNPVKFMRGSLELNSANGYIETVGRILQSGVYVRGLHIVLLSNPPNEIFASTSSFT